MTSNITAASLGLVLAASLLATGCDDKKETPKPDNATTAAAKADDKKTEAKADDKKAEAKATATVDAKEAGTAKAAADGKKDGKAGSCGKGSCGKGSCG